MGGTGSIRGGGRCVCGGGDQSPFSINFLFCPFFFTPKAKPPMVAKTGSDHLFLNPFYIFF